jgi:hypothetical protein
LASSLETAKRGPSFGPSPLREISGGVTNLLANKNHYTRWEGRLDFFRWCEKVGLKADGTMGPSKRGGCGFPRGTCQPWRPLDDEAAPPRFLDVYEIPLITQDLDIHLPSRSAPKVLDQVVTHGGLAHFLFHPAHIQKPGMADALQMLVGQCNMALALTEAGVVFHQFSPPDGKLRDKAEYKVVRDEKTKTTVYELRLPLATLGLEPGAEFDFNIVFLDDDDGKGHRYWLQLAPGLCGRPAANPRYILAK